MSTAVRNELNDITSNNSNGNPQSAAANIKASTGKRSLRTDILNFIKANPNVIAEDVLAAFPTKRYSSVTARVSELRADGLVTVVGTRKTQYSGSDAAVLVASIQ